MVGWTCRGGDLGGGDCSVRDCRVGGLLGPGVALGAGAAGAGRGCVARDRECTRGAGEAAVELLSPRLVCATSARRDRRALCSPRGMLGHGFSRMTALPARGAIAVASSSWAVGPSPPASRHAPHALYTALHCSQALTQLASRTSHLSLRRPTGYWHIPTPASPAPAPRQPAAPRHAAEPLRGASDGPWCGVARRGEACSLKLAVSRPPPRYTAARYGTAQRSTAAGGAGDVTEEVTFHIIGSLEYTHCMHIVLLRDNIEFARGPLIKLTQLLSYGVGNFGPIE